MYKIIYLSMTPEDTLYDGHRVDLLNEEFATIEEARAFIHDILIENDKHDFIDGDDETAKSAEFNVVDEIPVEVNFEISNHGDLVCRSEYKIVEVE